ncbi:hypothetical protein [Kutzneria sp. NPDC052558]|uniref:hypothetical protein n=1 Tax=Kutzneria sp. NPDC052558 TaxID=3364121 RepID=UPI0037C8F065
MTKLDITSQFRGIDAFLATLDKPLHRRIIENYRRHAIFEITGHKDKIFTPEMTVEHPVYLFNGPVACLRLEGTEEILGYYSSLQQRQATVMVIADEKLAVADWGFASEAVFHSYMPGSCVPAWMTADPDKLYIYRQATAMVWPYDDRGRLIGEHVYRHSDGAELIEIGPDDFITLDEAREKLLPLQRELPPLDLLSAR